MLLPIEVKEAARNDDRVAKCARKCEHVHRMLQLGLLLGKRREKEKLVVSHEKIAVHKRLYLKKVVADFQGMHIYILFTCVYVYM